MPTYSQAAKASNAKKDDKLTTIYLDGYLGRRYGKVHRLYGVETIPQAVSALDALHTGFRRAIEEKEYTPTPYRYHVKVNKKTIGEKKIGLRVSGKVIRITPVIRGSSNTKAIIEVVAGVVLAAVGAFTFGITSGIGVSLILAGIGYAAAGLSSIIAGTPGVDSSSQDNTKKASSAFNGPVNQTEQGGAVGLLYGQLVVGSATVSGSVVPSKIITNSTASGGGTSSTPGVGGGGGGASGPGRPVGVVAAAAYNERRNGPARPVARIVAGAGGGSSSTPTEAKVSLISTQTMQILDCISEGEVEGLGADPLLNVYLNETPIKNPDGTLNFQNVDFYFNSGTQDQQYIPGFDAEEDSQPVGIEIKQAYPWVQHFENLDLNAIRIVIRLPALSTLKSNGDIDGAKVEFKFELRCSTSDWTELFTDTISGYSPSTYTQGYEIPLDNGPGPWDVRVTRLTADSTSSKLNNHTVIDSVSQIIYGKFRHPNRAIAGLKISSEQFTDPPTRAFNMKGIKVLVPTIYDPVTKTYDDSVIWDGSFKVAWTDNPAWCWYDLVTNSRYGLGNYVKTGNIDRFALMKIARYCDQLVPDSVTANGTQCRFTMNHYIQTRDDALKIISDMASNFRGMLYYINGAITAVQDRVADYVCANYAPANVENGKFTYAGVDIGNLHNCAYVRWNDPENLSKVDVEPSENQPDIALNGLNDTQITGIGCAVRGQARRLGEYTIVTELIQDETVTFRTGFAGGFRMPGDVVAISNPFRSGEKFQGLVSSVNGTTVTLDRAVTLKAGTAYQLSAISLVDDGSGTGTNVTQVVYRNITNAAGTWPTLTLSQAFDTDPTSESVFIIVTANLQPELWSVLTVTQDGVQAHEITCIKYNASKYDAVDRDYKLVYPTTTDAGNPDVCQPPGAITITEVASNNAGVVGRSLAVSWLQSPDPYVQSYVASFQISNGNWTMLPAQGGTSLTLPFTATGTYNFSVAAKNVLGVLSTPVTASYDVGPNSPVNSFTVSGLELTGQANNTNWIGLDAKFDWRLNSPTAAQPIGSETNGAPSGDYDPLFKDYRVSIVNPDTGLEVYSEYVTVPNYTFTYAKNGQAFGQPRNNFTISVYARDAYNNISAPDTLKVTNPPPAPPSALTAFSSFQNIYLEFIPATDLDLEATEILVSTTGNLADAVVKDAGTATSFVLSGITTGQAYAFWARSRDTFENRSNVFPTGDGVVCVPGTVQATDIATFAINATGAFGNIVVLQGAVWSNNTPTALAIAWNAHKVFWQGVAYPIAAGSSTDMYVYWIAGEAAYRTSQTNPADSAPNWLNETHYQIAINVDNTGVYDLAWYGFANAVIGSAFISNAAITTAKINDAAITSAKIGSAQVDTLQLAGQAVTIPVGTSGALVQFKDWTTVLTLAVESTGAPAQISASWGHANDGGADGAGAIGEMDSCNFRIRRLNDNIDIMSQDFSVQGGTEIISTTAYDPQTLDGITAQYALQMRGTKGANEANLAGGTSRYPSLTYLEVKR